MPQPKASRSGSGGFALPLTTQPMEARGGAETPAACILFDILAAEREILMNEPLRVRREKLR